MKISEVIVEQQILDEGITDWLNSKVNDLLDKVFGPPSEKLEPGELEKIMGGPVFRIADPSNEEMRVEIEKYMAQAKIDREAKKAAEKLKSTSQRVIEVVKVLGAIVLAKVDHRQLGKAIGELIIWLLRIIMRALLKRA